MKPIHSILGALLMAAAAVPAATGCAASPEEAPPGGSGDVVPKIPAALTAGDVARVVIDIRGTQSTFARSIELTRSGDSFAGHVDNLVPGRYAFDARAERSDGAALFVGQANDVLVVAGQETILDLNLH